MVAQITPLPDPPSRSTQNRQEFVIATDNWLLGIQTFTVEANAMAVEMDALAVTVDSSATAAQDAADRAEAAASFRVSLAFATRAQLFAVSGTYVGQSAGVFADATTAYNGVYNWNGSAWTKVADLPGGTVAWASVTDKPSVFPPDAHTQAISTITGLQTALNGKAAVGAVGSSGLTMTSARLLGRTTASTGAVEQITVGTGLDLTAGVLTATGGGGSMVYPASGIAVSTGSAWTTSLAVPSGGLVGITASQTLTNKTLTSPTINGGTDTTTKTGGTLQAGVTVNDTGGVATTSPGYRGTPVRSVSTTTLVVADNGKMVVATGNVTIPSTLPVGFSCTIYNNSGSSSTVSLASGTLRLAGTASTGSRSLAQRGFCFVGKPVSGEIAISGNLS